jgi:hypothetical protein
MINSLWRIFDTIFQKILPFLSNRRVGILYMITSTARTKIEGFVDITLVHMLSTVAGSFFMYAWGMYSLGGRPCSIVSLFLN